MLLNDINGNEVSEVTMDYSRAIGQMISGIPTTLIINREGFIVSGFVGPRREQVFYNAIKPYLLDISIISNNLWKHNAFIEICK